MLEGATMSTAIEYEIRRLSPEMAGMRMSPEEFDAVEEWDEDYIYGNRSRAFP